MRNAIKPALGLLNQAVTCLEQAQKAMLIASGGETGRDFCSEESKVWEAIASSKLDLQLKLEGARYSETVCAIAADIAAAKPE